MDLVRRRMALHRAKLGDFLPTGARYSAKTPFWCAARMPFSPHCGLMYPQGAAKAVTSFLLLSFSIPKNRCKGNSTSRCQTAALYAPTVPSDKGIALLPVKYLRGFGKTSLALCLISLLANEKREQTAVCSRIDSIVYALSHLAAVPMSDIRQDAALPAKRPSLQTE